MSGVKSRGEATLPLLALSLSAPKYERTARKEVQK